MAAVVPPAEIAQFGPPTLAGLETGCVVWRATVAFNYAGVTIMLWDMLLTMKMQVCFAFADSSSVWANYSPFDTFHCLRSTCFGEQSFLSLRLRS
jgi:hypothetical protein